MRPNVLTLVLLAAAIPAAAQQPFVAPSPATILGTAEASSAIAPTRNFFVVNKSTVPIVVYSLDLWSCVNVLQPCESSPVHVVIPPRGRASIGRVDAKDRRKKYTYDWTYQYHPDTTDAAVVAVLREHGLMDHALVHSENVAVQDSVHGTAADALAGRAGGRVFMDANNRPVATSEKFRFKVARGSILGSTQTPGAAVPATGACINPAELAMYEADTTITGHPAVAPQLMATSIALPRLPSELEGVTPRDASVRMRWVVDTSGATVPGSVSVRESPHGLLSVKMCGAVLGAHLVPGKDETGHPVRTWVEAPIRIAN